ncbi:oligopeptide transport ATP-binding protein OppF [Halalkalibacter akibai JCM 9157]|uniref:Oligopeptide transport ATP-binding protein OppF n=1 Tax=Halalkalibacter akibai (strain ATCC 43226 / DSM 21942 / CIP 109018 / JCM 9157 / 1139) TaxID=1236973 RepID=W4QWT7_HALA3|nr:oligopeptide transport ATP-binding protein OppF [Halalkalibacter akibai JCM 9157]
MSKDYPVKARKRSWIKRSPLKVINEVSLTIDKGECIGLVGESGSGKSTLAKLIMKLEPLTSGEIFLESQAISGKKYKDIEFYRRVQLVLQDSSSALHPKMNVKESLLEPIQNYFPSEKANWIDMLTRVVELVGLDASYLTRYPHQLSGGQKQRVCIAKALAVQPQVIIFDESIASLDSDSQDLIIKMLKAIQQKEQISYLFITHDLQSTKDFCNRIAVMYKGEIVEELTHWDTEQVKHSYTRSLIEALIKV